MFTYFISTSALAGFAVAWRNWLEDHPTWKDWLHGHFRGFAKILTCGSCFTLWITLAFVLIFNPLQNFGIPYWIQWMSLGWGALFLRFSYVALQETVNKLVH